MKLILEAIRTVQDGAHIELTCKLAVDSSGSVFLCDTFEDGVRGKAIYLSNGDEIVAQMNGVVPPYGGGSCLYFEDCTVAGVLTRDLNKVARLAANHCVLQLEDGEVLKLGTTL